MDEKSRAEYFQNVAFRQMDANRGAQKGIKRLRARVDWLEDQHRRDAEQCARLELHIRQLERGLERAKARAAAPAGEEKVVTH